MTLPMFAVSFVLSVAVLAHPATLSKQSPQTPQPAQDATTFRSGVDILRIPVAALDDRGEPVRDLQPSDFSVKVDGAVRKLLFANYFGPENGSSTPPAPAPAQVMIPSYATNTESQPGRVVAVAVDLISVRQGNEAAILETAARLVESLAPNDTVGLMPVPGRGVDLTRDHARVATALRALQGTTNLPFITHYLTIREAVAFEQLNRRIINEAIERECCATCVTCPGDLQNDARQLLQFARQHVESVLTSVTNLAASLKAVAAPKTIVLISAGLPFDQEYLGRFVDLQRALREAGIMIYSVQVAQADNDAGNSRRPGVGAYQAADIATGLANVATMAGGAMFMGVGTASGVFDQLRAEITTGYELAVESIPSDADGKAHDVQVTVRRPGVRIRSRPQIVLPVSALEPSQRLVNLLVQPVDVRDVPVAVAAYTVRGEEPDTLKVIVAGEIGGDAKLTGPVRYALRVMQEDKVIFQTDDVAIDGARGPRMVTAVQLRPGRYQLRFGAIDSAARAGSLQMPVSVGLRMGSALQFSDLFIGVTERTFTPVIRAVAGQTLDAFVEVYSSDPTLFSKATVRFEVRKDGESGPVAELPGQMRPTDLERRRLADVKLPTNGWPAGRHIVSAVISIDGKPVGRVSRAIRVGPE